MDGRLMGNQRVLRELIELPCWRLGRIRYLSQCLRDLFTYPAQHLPEDSGYVPESAQAKALMAALDAAKATVEQVIDLPWWACIRRRRMLRELAGTLPA